MNKTLAALQSYTKDFYSKTEFGESNIVGSPLGSWLLLASIASNLDFSNNATLKELTENSLHMKTEEAENAVKELLANYPALNYVAQAWTVPDLSALPAVQKWVEANTLIPYEGKIPSQEQVDEWASTNTNDLIKEFPAQMNDATMLVIANIIYSKLAWRTKFRAVPAQEAMKGWGVENVLNVVATHDILFCKNADNDIFAIYEVKAFGEYKESVRLVTCLSKEVKATELMEALTSVGALESILPNDESLLALSTDMYRVKEVKQGTSRIVVEANVPAWDASSEHALMESAELGYQHLAEAFREGSDGSFSVEAKQVAVAKFDKDGFEAAALTTMMMSRSAMPRIVTQTVYELNFTKPFVFVSFSDNLPMFSGYICKAKEGE